MAPAWLESRVSTSHVWMVEYFIIVQWKRSKKYFLNVLTLVDDSFRFLCIYHLHCADIIFPLFAITHISMGLNAHALYSFDGAADQVDCPKSNYHPNCLFCSLRRSVSCVLKWGDYDLFLKEC